MIDLSVFATIAGAIVAWALSQLARNWKAARVCWTLGAVLIVVHSAAAYVVFYEASHAVALAATARQAAAVTGIAAGSGLYVNCLFLAIWVADAAWWWTAARSYRRRPRWVETTIQGVFFFMFVNGAVIFADGWMRVLGFAACAAVAAAWYKQRKRGTVALSPAE